MIKLYDVDSYMKEFTAKLIHHTQECVILEIDGNEKEFPKNKISSIRLTVEF